VFNNPLSRNDTIPNENMPLRLTRHACYR
jgi:hypothetical protein